MEQKEDEKACPSFAPTVCTHKKNGLSPLLKNIILCAITICVLEDRKSSTTLQSIIEPWNNRKKKIFCQIKRGKFFCIVSVYSTLFSLQLQYCISIKIEKKDYAFFQKSGEPREFCYQYVILTRYFINLGCFFLNQSRIHRIFCCFSFPAKFLTRLPDRQP